MVGEKSAFALFGGHVDSFGLRLKRVITSGSVKLLKEPYLGRCRPLVTSLWVQLRAFALDSVFG